MMKKEKKGKRAYLNDFVPDVDGKYIYAGSHYEWIHPLPRSSHLIKIWCFTVFAAVLVLICGFLPSGGMKNSFYVIIPYIIEFCTVISTISALCKMTYGGQTLREYVYTDSAAKLPLRTYLVTSGAVLSFVCEVVYVTTNHLYTNNSVDILIASLQIVVAGLFVLVHRQIDEIHWLKK